MKKRLLVGIGGVLFWMISHQVQAYNCKVLAAAPLNPPDLIVQRDLPLGSPIGSEVVSGVTPVFSCTNEAPALTKQEFGVKASTTYYVMMLGGRRIYDSGVAGIGYAVGGTSVSSCNATGYVDGSNTGDTNLNNRILCVTNGLLPNQPVTAKAHIQFYKTAQTTGSGSIDLGNVVSFILRNQGKDWTAESYVNVASFNVKSVACSVKNTAIAVPMGAIVKRAFKGPGTWPDDANTRSFGIDLACDAGTKINFQIDGSAQDASRGILNLTGGNGSATGVGIQLLYKDAPLVLSSVINNGVVSGSGNYSIPLKARYYQTASNITSGTANASATFTLTYQ